MNGINPSVAYGIALETARRRIQEAQTRLQISDDIIRRSAWTASLTDFGVIAQLSRTQREGKKAEKKQ